MQAYCYPNPNPNRHRLTLVITEFITISTLSRTDVFEQIQIMPKSRDSICILQAWFAYDSTLLCFGFIGFVVQTPFLNSPIRICLYKHETRSGETIHYLTFTICKFWFYSRM